MICFAGFLEMWGGSVWDDGVGMEMGSGNGTGERGMKRRCGRTSSPHCFFHLHRSGGEGGEGRGEKEVRRGDVRPEQSGQGLNQTQD